MFFAGSYLQQYDLSTSIQRYRETLKQLTRKFGGCRQIPRNHYLVLLITIAERIEEQGTDEPQSFVRTNPDLFATKPSLISQFYSNELIASDRIWRAFLLPQPYQSQSCARAITSIP